MKILVVPPPVMEALVVPLKREPLKVGELVVPLPSKRRRLYHSS